MCSIQSKKCEKILILIPKKSKTRFLAVFIFPILLSCNTTNTGDHNGASDIFGAWRLESIEYQTGETLKPSNDQLYWIYFREDIIEAEGGLHYLINGGAYCNWSEGWFDYTEDKSIEITFICERLVCGIATEYCTAVNTSRQFSFSKDKLLMHFDSVVFGKGVLILKPYKP